MKLKEGQTIRILDTYINEDESLPSPKLVVLEPQFEPVGYEDTYTKALAMDKNGDFVVLFVSKSDSAYIAPLRIEAAQHGVREE